MTEYTRSEFTGGTYRDPSGGSFCQFCGDLYDKRTKLHSLRLGPEKRFKLKICSKCFKKLKAEVCDG